jgi:ADP-dependent phosphofructokinase/glucokinase
MAKKIYSHAVSLNIEVKSSNEVPTGEELLKAYQDRIKEMESLKGDDLESCFEVFDSDEE